jgi:hypothetical protein
MPAKSEFMSGHRETVVAEKAYFTYLDQGCAQGHNVSTM